MHTPRHLSKYLRHKIIKDFQGGKSIELISAKTLIPINRVKEAVHKRKIINNGKL